MSFQSVTVLGNVGKDPEIRTTNSGEIVANFSIAVSEKRKGAENTVWFNCVAFGKTAQVVEGYVKRGGKILVQGRIQTREYEKNGVRQRTWEVLVNQLSLEGSRADGEQGNKGYPAATGRDDINAPLDDEIPF